MASNLIIVESVGKVKKIKQYAGSGYRVMASYGHVRDLPPDELGVDTGNGFDETYQVTNSKAVKSLKAAARQADTIYLATDPDREGEAIAWHICQLLSKRDLKKVRRITFNAITEAAVRQALASPGGLNLPLVEAARARRVLDRLIGYPISRWLQLQDFGLPSNRALSAGRVQTAGLRIIVDRERHRRGFVPESYYTIHALLHAHNVAFTANLSEPPKATSSQECRSILDALRSAPAWWVADYTTGRSLNKPDKPLITSTMQQLASKRLRLSPGRSQQAAQELYEAGLITYLRTDSVRTAPEAVAAARACISQIYGATYLPDQPPQYEAAAGAQDAHECIRPADPRLQPDQVAAVTLSAEALSLYGLIWRVFIASQMLPAVYQAITVLVRAGDAPDRPLPYLFTACARTRIFDGCEAVFDVKEEDDEPREEDEDTTTNNNIFIPPLAAGAALLLRGLSAQERQTKPRPAYSQAGLVKALEVSKIGRPSTYAGAVEILLERGYAEMKGRNIIPTPLGEQVVDRLVAYYPQVFDLPFSASMEALLDQVAGGKTQRLHMLAGIYNQLLAPAFEKAQRLTVANHPTNQVCPRCGSLLVRQHGKHGPFMGCSAYPGCPYTCSLDPLQEATK